MAELSLSKRNYWFVQNTQDRTRLQGKNTKLCCVKCSAQVQSGRFCWLLEMLTVLSIRSDSNGWFWIFNHFHGKLTAAAQHAVTTIVTRYDLRKLWEQTRTIAHLHIHQTQSIIGIHLESCFWLPDELYQSIFTLHAALLWSDSWGK